MRALLRKQKTLSDLISEWCLRTGLNDANLAGKLRKTPETIGNWRIGKSHPPAKHWQALAKALGGTVYDIGGAIAHALATLPTSRSGPEKTPKILRAMVAGHSDKRERRRA